MDAEFMQQRKLIGAEVTTCIYCLSIILILTNTFILTPTFFFLRFTNTVALFAIVLAFTFAIFVKMLKYMES